LLNLVQIHTGKYLIKPKYIRKSHVRTLSLFIGQKFWGRRRKLQTGSSFCGVKVNQSNKDECGSFPSHSII
ncbi:hypothetical protein LDENG_00208980, partial [Lucifuga dentata]